MFTIIQESIPRRYIGYMEKASIKRLDYIDMAKGIGIILVVCGHIVYTRENILVWISSFHMPLFFVIAGAMMSIKGESSIDIRKKFNSLIIPYLWFSLIDFIIDIGNVLLGKIDTNAFITNAISSITFYGKSVLWFLTALFLAEVYFSFILRQKLPVLQIIIIAIIAVVSILIKDGLNLLFERYGSNLIIISVINVVRTVVRAGIVLPFLGFGYYIWKLLSDKIENFSKLDGSKVNVLEIIISIVMLVIGYYVAIANWAVDTNNMILGQPVLYYLGGFLGSFGVIILCKNLPSLRVLSYLGKNSLIIMSTHLDCYILWAGLTISLYLFRYIPNLTLLVILTVVFTLLINCIPIELINRYFPFIIGKKRKK